MCLYQEKWFLYGIISFGFSGKCGSPNRISGFTRLSPFYEWIRRASVSQ